MLLSVGLDRQHEGAARVAADHINDIGIPFVLAVTYICSSR